jgi:urease subunit alpha
MSQSAVDKNVPEKLKLGKRVVAVSRCRSISKRDMKLNDGLPKITVNPETYQVSVDGQFITCEPAKELPMAQRYFLF